MKWRIFASVALIIGLFVVFCFTYYRKFIVRRPHGIVVVVAPGIDSNLLSLASQRTPGGLTWFGKGGTTALARVWNQDGKLGDLPSIMTQFSAAEPVPRGHIGVSASGQDIDNLFYIAQRMGRNIGLISTTRLTSAGVAAFYAHAKTPDDQSKIAHDLLDSTRINVMLGGGSRVFSSMKDGGGRDLLLEADKLGYTSVNNRDKLLDVPAWRTRRLFGLFAPEEIPPYPGSTEFGQAPSLSEMTLMAIECLQYNLGGYFLVIEDHRIAKAMSHNQARTAVAALAELDEAITTAQAYAGENSLIVVYSPFSVGGLQITGEVDETAWWASPVPWGNIPTKKTDGTPGKPVEVTASNFTLNPPPVIAWQNGPGGPVLSPQADPKKSRTKQPPPPPVDPALQPEQAAGFNVETGGLPSAGYGLIFIRGMGEIETRPIMDPENLHWLVRDQF
jgi:hypothetical protein